MDRMHRQGSRDLLSHAVAPALALWGLIVGIGFALTGPLIGLSRAEESVNRGLAADRTRSWNAITSVWSEIGNTVAVITVCVIVAGCLLWRTRDRLLAAVPVIAIGLQGLIFFTVSNLIDRDRPAVAKLDASPPTTSYPSGHVGASTALYVALALIALRIERGWLRRTTVLLCLAMPLLVMYARLYRGMHHVTDVGAAMLNGILCALLAYGWHRHRRARARAGTPGRDPAS